MNRPDLTPYAPLPYSVLQRTDLGPADKLCLAVLADLRPGHDGWAGVSLGQLCRTTALSRRGVQQALACLERAALADILRRPGRRLAVRIRSGLGGQGRTECAGEGRTKCAGGAHKMRGGGAQNAPPLARTVFPTPPSHLGGPPQRGVPPLVWERARAVLAKAHAEAFEGATPPASWWKKLAEELEAGNLGLPDELDAPAVLAGLKAAIAAKRPFGFGWVVQAVEQRQAVRAARRRPIGQDGPRPGLGQKLSPGADVAAPGPAVEIEAAEAARRREHWDGLPEPQRQRYLAAAADCRFGPKRPEVVAAMAVELAWREKQAVAGSQ
ncbi:MAG TPA: hypothetical protein PK082_01695 [Phycisphaerae bacterium]|mgnify:CR=1 FL=1|nr:hypothetical protein [Phycisphaerae bacterium]